MEKLARDKEYLLVVFQAVSMFIVAPIAYALVAYFIKESQPITKQTNPLLLYGLLAISVIVIAVLLPIVTKALKGRHLLAVRGKSPVQAAYTIRLVMVESVFILGLLYFFLAWETDPIIYFYIIGGIGVLMHWPTRERFDNLANQLEGK